MAEDDQHFIALSPRQQSTIITRGRLANLFQRATAMAAKNACDKYLMDALALWDLFFSFFYFPYLFNTRANKRKIKKLQKYIP